MLHSRPRLHRREAAISVAVLVLSCLAADAAGAPPTRRDDDYRARVCRDAPARTSCRAGRGRRTRGGSSVGKVSHRHWPRITGVFLTFPSFGGGRLIGAERADELLGHHRSDRISGRGSRDVIWGDWDAVGNSTRQRDHLSGGPGSDFIYTSHGRNTVFGGSGNDFIWASHGHGTIDCGPGIDKVRVRKHGSRYRLRHCELRGKF